MKRSRTAPSRANKPAPVHDGAAREPLQTPPVEAVASERPPGPAPTPSPLLDTAEGVRAFHEVARDALLDLAAAAREGARKPRKRILSRAEIRRQAREGYAELASLLDLAAEALAARFPP
jgi:hypothetical protein